MLAGLGELLRRDDSLPATAPTSLPRGLETGASSLPDQITLELRQCAKQMKDQAAARCCGVDVFGDRSEPDAFGLQFGDDLDEVLHRSAETVELPDRERVTSPDIANGFRQSWAIGLRSRCLVLENLFAAGLAQRIELQGGILISGGDPCVANGGHEVGCPFSRRMRTVSDLPFHGKVCGQNLWKP